MRKSLPLAGTGEQEACALLVEQLLPPLLSLALLAPQIQGSCVSMQELQALRAERDSQGGAGCRNNMVRTGLPEAETHWRKGEEHPMTAPCYSIIAGLFSAPLGRERQRNLI